MDESFVQNVVEAITLFGFGGGILLLFCIIAESFLRWREGRRPFSREMGHNYLFFPLGPLMEGVVANALLIAALTAASQLTPLHIPVNWWTLPLYFLTGEFAFYIFHRAGHELRIFWADHSIHHSAETYDFTVNLRHTPFSTLYRLLTWTPLALLGFHPLILVLMAINIPAFQTFCHTQRIGRLAPWFEWLFVTPSNHAVHHACNPLYLDKNYGGLLMIWDHVFGTYQRLEESEPPVFGITRQPRSTNPLVILTHEFRYLARDVRAAPGFLAKLKVLLGKPGKTFQATHVPDPLVIDRSAAKAAGQ
ncbi:sterol desaturase family protein [Sphingobium sp.]|uniref:sterol desaturase family protein n=1 Tax=Sphingobium sp. TaxID=1912891 RepID=UPI0035C6FE53